MSRYGSRIAALARRADRERASLDPDDASPEEAMAYLREGAGQAIWLYVEGRTGGRMVPYSEDELAALRNAMNAWLECYAACHGVDMEAEFTVREAAEVLLETRNVRDTARLLTHVPARGTRERSVAGSSG